MQHNGSARGRNRRTICAERSLFNMRAPDTDPSQPFSFATPGFKVSTCTWQCYWRASLDGEEAAHVHSSAALHVGCDAGNRRGCAARGDVGYGTPGTVRTPLRRSGRLRAARAGAGVCGLDRRAGVRPARVRRAHNHGGACSPWHGFCSLVDSADGFVGIPRVSRWLDTLPCAGAGRCPRGGS